MKKTLQGILWIILILLILSFALPPFGIWPLIPIGFALMVWVQYRILPEKIHFLAPSLTISSIITASLIMYYGISNSILDKLYPVIFICLCLITWLIERKKLYKNQTSRFRYLPIEQTLIWVSYGLVRSFIPMMGTAGFVSYSCYKSPWLIQPISYVGIYGLEFVLVFLGYSIGMLIIWQYDKLNKSSDIINKPTFFWLKISSALFAMWLIISLMQYFIPAKENPIMVGALETDTEKLESLEGMVHQASVMGAKLIICPEGTYIDGDIRNDKYGQFAERLAKKEDVYLIICDKIKEDKTVLTELAFINPKGNIIGISGNDHANKLLGDTEAVEPVRVYSMTFGTIGTMLGYNQFYIDTTRDMAKKGAGLILVSANESKQVSIISPAYLIFRAVENQVGIVKAETGYSTLFISSKGEVISGSNGYKGSISAIVVSDINIGRADALHIKIGDTLAWCALIALFFLQPIKQFQVLLGRYQ